MLLRGTDPDPTWHALNLGIPRAGQKRGIKLPDWTSRTRVDLYPNDPARTDDEHNGAVRPRDFPRCPHGVIITETTEVELRASVRFVHVVVEVVVEVRRVHDAHDKRPVWRGS